MLRFHGMRDVATVRQLVLDAEGRCVAGLLVRKPARWICFRGNRSHLPNADGVNILTCPPGPAWIDSLIRATPDCIDYVPSENRVQALNCEETRRILNCVNNATGIETHPTLEKKGLARAKGKNILRRR